MKNLFDFLMTQDVTPNGLFTLWSINEGVIYSNYVNVKIELLKLERKGFVNIKDNLFTITAKGLQLVKTSQKHMSKTGKIKKTSFDDWQDYIVEFNSLFPKGRREGSSVGYRTNPRELLTRFVWFFEEYPEYKWKDVLYATKRYIEAFDNKNDYTYLQNSKYFIKKVDQNKLTTSTLADVCYTIAEGNDINVTEDGFHFFG